MEDLTRPRLTARVVGRAEPPEKTVVRTELPPGRFELSTPAVHFENVTIRNVDFSGLRGWNLTAAGATFENCRFDEMAIEHATLGVPPSSTYRSCSFRNADLRAVRPGHARLERCDFAGSKIEEWFTFCAEFVDCSFSGAEIVGSKFSGRPQECFGLLEFRRRRRRNDFRGNDFADAELIDSVFVGGIDLDLQRLPEHEPYFRLNNARERIERALERLESNDGPARDLLLSRLRTLHFLAEDQEDLFLRRDELDLPPDAETRLLKLLGVN